MLKKQIFKKSLITTAVLFSVFLMCLMPNKKLQKNMKQELSYVDDNLNKQVIYLLDSNNMIARTSVVMDNQDITLKAKELLNILIEDSSGENKIPSGFKGLIPSNTEILSIEYKNNLIKVNFNEYLLDVKKENEEKVIEAIIYTLTSIKEIKQVIIYINGDLLTILPKSKINLPSTLDRSYGINKEYDLKTYKDVNKVTVYYLNKYNDNYYYVPVTKYLNDGREKIEIIIDQLANSNNKLMSFLNNNTTLVSKRIEDKTMYLVFNQYIFDDFDSQNILEEVIYSINLSIDDNYDVEQVVFEYNDREIYKSVLKTIESS